MSETANRAPMPRLQCLLQSPLHAFGLAQRVRDARPADGVLASELPHLGCIVLRGRPQDDAFMAQAATVLGLRLPTTPMTVTACQAGVLLWLSPDEWLLVCSRSRRDALLQQLTTALAGVHAQVVDNSGGLAVMRLSGRDHTTLLRHLGPYDFQSLAVGRCVATVAQKTTVTVCRTDDVGVVVIFRRSFADYAWRLLEEAARSYGLCITPVQAHADPLFTPLLETA